MAVDNILQQVQLYATSEIAWLQNSTILLSPDSKITNTEFDNFQNRPGNLGDTVTFDRAPRARVETSLVVTARSSQQRKETLSVTNVAQTNNDFNSKEFVFNDVDEYMSRYGKANVLEMATVVEEDLMKNFISAFVVNNSQDPNVGSVVNPSSGPYRFFANGWQPGDLVIPEYNSVTQLANSRTLFKNYGASNIDYCTIIPDTVEPTIVGNSLNQFVTRRNELYADNWWIGNQGQCDYYSSNLLPTHFAGTVGNSGTLLTVVSTNETNGITTQITFSGATPNDPDAIKRGDLIQFLTDDGLGGNTFRYLRFIGHGLSDVPVQVRSLSNVASDGAGNVVINIYPDLVSDGNSNNQNIPQSIQPGQQVGIPPDHKGGIMMSGRPFYFASPMLNNTTPYPCYIAQDEETGLSMRSYWGAIVTQDQYVFIRDMIYGATLVAEQSMRMLFPA